MCYVAYLFLFICYDLMSLKLRKLTVKAFSFVSAYSMFGPNSDYRPVFVSAVIGKLLAGDLLGVTYLDELVELH